MLFDLDAIYYKWWRSTGIYELINLNVKFKFLLVAIYYIWWHSTRIYGLISLKVKFKFLLVSMYYIWRRSTRIYDIINLKEIQDGVLRGGNPELRSNPQTNRHNVHGDTPTNVCMQDPLDLVLQNGKFSSRGQWWTLGVLPPDLKP